MTVVDTEALRRKYADERAKRLRPDGNDQYLQFTGQFADMIEDPYTERVEREPLRDHVTFAFIGGGFAGLVTGARLKEAGVADVRIVEKGGDFGGTWYWNRYPGAQCDTASMIYLPLLEETGHMPTERYVHAPEILEHCQRIAKQYGLYENALFHTRVTGLEWDEAVGRWIVRTDRGDEFTAQFVGWGTGPLHVAKLPGIAGIDAFAGHAFHTSRWDYAYTGGDPAGAPLDRLGDKRVAIIGTGATAVQCVPHLAAGCRELFVFQRTPSSVDVRDNQPIDPAWFAGVADTPGWQQRWLENFVANMTPGEWPAEDLVNDGWTDLSKRMRGRVLELSSGEITPEQVAAEVEAADFEKMTEIRDRVNSIVGDPQTAESLKAWYRQLCKRPCFHDEYLDAYNQPNVHLVDTDGRGVERITRDGVVVAGVEYPVDCIIYASGFEVGTSPTRRTGFDVTGRGGVLLSEYWGDRMRTMHGIHMHGFPNAFVVQLSQGANFVANVPHNLSDSAKTVAAVVAHAAAGGYGLVEVTREAQDAWMELVIANPVMRRFLSTCTPGYYNNEGGELSAHSLFGGYVNGAAAFFRYIEQWRSSGEFAGLEFS
jgi:cation diffusion facilitator CzcD-associated flavoprotein CzcO